MRPLNDSAGWAHTLRHAHRVTHRAEVYSAGKPVSKLPSMPGFVGGSVTLDGTAAVRGQCSLQFVDDGSLGLVPKDSASWLAPLGNEIRVWRGVYDAAGNGQEVSLGIFRIQDTSWDDTQEGLSINVTGFGREQKVIEDTFIGTSLSIAGSSPLVGTIQTLVKDAMPDASFLMPSTSKTIGPIPVVEGDDRWQLCQDMAFVGNYELYFDGDGVCVMSQIQNPNNVLAYQADEEYAEGDQGLLVDLTTDWSREGSPNRVIFTAENTRTSTVYRKDVWDTDPNSPTFYAKSDGTGGGPYGKVHLFTSGSGNAGSLIDSQQQTDDAAIGTLAKLKGLSKSISFGGIVNPALEPGDVIKINRQRAGITSENHLIDSLTIPLDASSPMTAQTRATQVFG